MSAFLPFRPKRPRIHCSIDVLFHAGVLWVTGAVSMTRKTIVPYRAPGSFTISEDSKTMTVTVKAGQDMAYARGMIDAQPVPTERRQVWPTEAAA